MNPQVAIALALINEIFVANGNQEITGTNSNPVLQAILNSLYGITGDSTYLNTADKTNLVSAINELKDLLGQITSIKLFSGNNNPNAFPPNGGDFELRDFYAQTSVGGNIALWIYTGVGVNGWVNLNQKDIIFTSSLPTSGIVNILYIRTSDDTMWRWYNGGGGGDPSEWRQLINQDEIIWIENLPASGIANKLYIRISDNTQWRWQIGGSIQYPVSRWVALSELSHEFTYDETNNIQILSDKIYEVVDVRIDRACNYNEVVSFTSGSNQVTFDSSQLLNGQKIKLIYK